jgi:hypothetical protein
MALKNTILGWLRRDDGTSDELDKAEADAATREYAEERAETLMEERFGSRPGEFEADGQSAPRN